MMMERAYVNNKHMHIFLPEAKKQFHKALKAFK